MASRYIKTQQPGQIDIPLLWRVLAGNFIKIGVIAVLLAAATCLYRYSNSVPVYNCSTKFLVSGVSILYDSENNYEVQGAIANPNSALGMNIAYNAPYIIKEDKALNNICEYLKENYDGEYEFITRRDIKGMLNVTVDNQIVKVQVTHANKKVAMDVATAVQNTVPAAMDYYFGVENIEGVENIDSVAKAISMVSEDNVGFVGRNLTVYTLAGFGIGLVVVYLFCLLRTYFDNTIYTEEDLKNRFTIPVIGQIPTWENAKVGEKAFKDKSRRDHIKGSKDSKNPDSGNLMSDRDYDGRLLTKKTPFAITEAFKALRTNLCYTTKGEKCAVYGITSAYVSAGKSLIIANAAISFAQMNKKVLLIDGDLRCPVLHKIFGLDNKVQGMSDLLAGMCTYEDIYHRNGGYENLNIITSGKIPPNPAELLASDTMKNFIAAVKEEYDVVLIDLPPICEVSDAGIIYDLVTGYVFVVRAGYSDRRMIDLAVEAMEGFGANISGFILNDIDIKSGEYYKNKYYSSYTKYRFRSGRTGYYKHFKYGYYKGYYSRYNRFYGSYGYKRGYSHYYSTYNKVHDEVTADESLEKLNNEQVLAEVEAADLAAANVMENAEIEKDNVVIEKDSIEIERDNIEIERDNAEPLKEKDEPKKEKADPKKEKADPKKEKADPKKEKADPKKEKADPKKAKADPKKGKADPKKGKGDTKKGKKHHR